MAWPPTPSAGYTINSGIGAPTTIVWGTDGLYTGIVKSVRSSQMIEEIKIENGTGLTAVQILLDDGVQVEVTVVDDASFAYPEAGEAATIFQGITGGSLIFTVVENSTSNSRKQEGERTITGKKYTLI